MRHAWFTLPYPASPSTYLQAIAENGRALVALVQEMFGDGIMSAINFYFTVSEVVLRSRNAKLEK